MSETVVSFEHKASGGTGPFGIGGPGATFRVDVTVPVAEDASTYSIAAAVDAARETAFVLLDRVLTPDRAPAVEELAGETGDDVEEVST